MDAELPAKKMTTRRKLIIGVIAGVFVLLVLGVSVLGAIGANVRAAKAAQSKSDFKVNFLSACRTGLVTQGGSTKFANGYCGCVYDDGVSQYGTKGLLTKSTANEGKGTPEFRQLAMKCVERFKDT